MGSGSDKYGNFVDILESRWKDEESGKQHSKILFFHIEHASKTMFGGLDLENLDKK